MDDNRTLLVINHKSNVECLPYCVICQESGGVASLQATKLDRSLRHELFMTSPDGLRSMPAYHLAASRKAGA